MTTDGERIIVRASTTPGDADGRRRQFVRKIEKPPANRDSQGHSRSSVLRLIDRQVRQTVHDRRLRSAGYRLSN